MSKYTNDREFTNYIHTNIAIPDIYEPLAWTEKKLDAEYALNIDLHNGIDYIFQNKEGETKTVQERFRESKYKNYNDFTIRYRRDENTHSERRISEYFKMKADYFTYGITNGEKNNLASSQSFLKYAIINLKKVYEKIDQKLIIILDNKENVCIIQNEKIICPVKYNVDGSSSFFPIDISFLVKLWGKEMIVSQKGFME